MKKHKLIALMGVAMLIPLLTFTSCKKNQQPVLVSVVVNPTAVDPGQTATVTVTATDPDSDPLTYAYTPNGGAISGTGPMVQWIAPSTAGAYSVAVTVSDGQGGVAQGSASLQVNEVVTFTGVSGTAGFLAGTAGDLSNAKVSLYTSLDNWNNNSPIKYGAVTGSGASVTFKLSANPGNYYLDIWKDNDNNGFWSPGDFIGWYGSGGLGSPALTEIQLENEQNFQCSITMYIY
jgi:hypothetical protein